MLKKLFTGMFGLALMGMSGMSTAATLTYDGGMITGAGGIIIDNIAYDVQFSKDSCDSLFNGCNNFSLTESQLETGMAMLAGELNGVSATAGDILGLDLEVFGVISTPHTRVGDNVIFEGLLYNCTFTCDGVTWIATEPSEFGNYDQPAKANVVHAVWTVSPVPIPPAVWLFGSGLLGLIGVARRKKA